ncbi:MAG: hypothetical protein BWY96_03187 [Spirochaetes bacterium ADurb.BinA120]|nr:MAG: hypothetical protein BWY96_03187 [Spirochaetes bacterium ADurb.BinA120]
MTTSFTPSAFASLTTRSAMICVFSGSPANIPKLTASKKLRVQSSFAALNMTAGWMMEWAPESPTKSTLAFFFSMGINPSEEERPRRFCTSCSMSVMTERNPSLKSSMLRPFSTAASASISSSSGAFPYPMSRSLAIPRIYGISMPKGQNSMQRRQPVHEKAASLISSITRSSSAVASPQYGKRAPDGLRCLFTARRTTSARPTGEYSFFGMP